MAIVELLGGRAGRPFNSVCQTVLSLYFISIVHHSNNSWADACSNSGCCVSIQSLQAGRRHIIISPLISPPQGCRGEGCTAVARAGGEKGTYYPNRIYTPPPSLGLYGRHPSSPGGTYYYPPGGERHILS